MGKAELGETDDGLIIEWWHYLVGRLVSRSKIHIKCVPRIITVRLLRKAKLECQAFIQNKAALRKEEYINSMDVNMNVNSDILENLFRGFT